MAPTLTHIALHVSDLAAVIAFYERFCGMSVCHRRDGEDSKIAWLAEPGREHELIIVVIDGGGDTAQRDNDYSHLGFAMHSKDDVDRIAALAESDGCLVWPPKQEPYPVGYYCGVRDPAGNFVEFSYGQPLGPGAPDSARG